MRSQAANRAEGDGMRWVCGVAAGALALTCASQGAAQSLRDRLSNGLNQAGTAVQNTARAVDQSVASAVQLAQGEATPEQTRATLDAMALATLQRLFAENPAAQAQFERSAGFAVFDTRRSTLLGITAGFGRGMAMARPPGVPTYMRMATGGVGFAFGIGGFESQVVFLFETPVDFEIFVRQGLDASAQAVAVAGDDKAEETLRFIDGRSIFVLGRKGWRVGATAAGTKYWPDPALN
jgi:hypothetical protein